MALFMSLSAHHDQSSCMGFEGLHMRNAVLALALALGLAQALALAMALALALASFLGPLGASRRPP